MIKLGKLSAPITLLHEGQEVNINGITFCVYKNIGWYLRGRGIHVHDVENLEDALYRIKQPSLNGLAETCDGYLERGIFPEFDSLKNLSIFYSILKNKLE